ncbi:hypothetical protein ACJX0J_037687, partial [Zea mays]
DGIISGSFFQEESRANLSTLVNTNRFTEKVDQILMNVYLLIIFTPVFYFVRNIRERSHLILFHFFKCLPIFGILIQWTVDYTRVPTCFDQRKTTFKFADSIVYNLIIQGFIGHNMIGHKLEFKPESFYLTETHK